MHEYRLYVLDEDGALHLPQEIEAPNDARAIELARERCVEGRQMELWQHKRKVHCWGFPDCPSHCE